VPIDRNLRERMQFGPSRVSRQRRDDLASLGRETPDPFVWRGERRRSFAPARPSPSITRRSTNHQWFLEQRLHERCSLWPPGHALWTPVLPARAVSHICSRTSGGISAAGAVSLKGQQFTTTDAPEAALWSTQQGSAQPAARNLLAYAVGLKSDFESVEDVVTGRQDYLSATSVPPARVLDR
jgi:hypothetical protein